MSPKVTNQALVMCGRFIGARAAARTVCTHLHAPDILQTERALLVRLLDA